MAFLLGDLEIASATVRLPQYGVWVARAVLAGEKIPPAGTRLTVQLGDLALSGTVRTSGSYAGIVEALVVGGADGWSKRLRRRNYRADNGVRLSTVVRDLALDTGETVNVPTDRTLGYAWTRPEGGAGYAASALGDWWVGPDGVTTFGPRTTVERTNLKFGVPRLDLIGKVAAVSPVDDRLSPYVPGTFISGDGLRRVQVRSSVIRVDSSSAIAEVMWI